MLRKLIFITCFILSSYSVFSQQKINNLLDSLSIVHSDKEVIDISLKIANELKYSDWKRATYYLDLAKKKAESSNSQVLLARFHRETAEIYYDVDAFDISINYYLKAYDYYQNNSADEQFKIENQLAIIYSQLNNNERAYYYFKRVYNHYKKTNNKNRLATALNNIGTLYLDSNKPDSALFYLKKSQDILKVQPNNELKSYILTNIARSYDLQGNTKNAYAYFQQAIKSLDATDDPNIKSYVYNMNADYFLKLNNPEKTIEFAKQSKAQNLPYYSFSNFRTYQLLYKSYLALGDYKESAKYFQEYDRIRDSLDIERKAVSIEKQRIEQDFKVKQEILKLQDKQKRYDLLIIIQLLLVLLLTLGLFLFRYRNRLSKLNLENELTKSQKRELELSLELKNKELTTKAMIEVERSEFFTSVHNEIKEIQQIREKDQMAKALNSLNNKVARNLSGTIWEDFEISFTNVHESFFEKLNEKHPNLTVFDKRICALIKLNLSTKEIAALSKNSVKSIENIRTRLRKKLGLTNQKIELYDYFLDF